MKDKVIAQLKAKFPGVNFSKARLDKIGESVAAKVTEEDQIEDKLNELNDFMPFADIAKNDDRIRGLAEKAAKDADKAKKKVTTTEDDADEPLETDDVNTKLFKQMQKLTKKIERLESEKTQKTLEIKLSEKIGKDIPAVFYKGRKANSEDELEQLAAEIKTDYEEFTQSTLNKELGTDRPPFGAFVPAGKKVDDIIDKWAGTDKK